MSSCVGSNSGCGDSTGGSILSSLETLLNIASMPTLEFVACSPLCLREAYAVLGMTIGMAKIVRALRCLDVPCICGKYHIQHKQSRQISTMQTTIHCLTSPAVSVAEFAAD